MERTNTAGVFNSTPNPYLYSGNEVDRMNGLNQYDFHARWLSSAIPGFTSPDPLAEYSFNESPYMYCSGDPVNRTDPWGLFDNFTITSGHDSNGDMFGVINGVEVVAKSKLTATESPYIPQIDISSFTMPNVASPPDLSSIPTSEASAASPGSGSLAEAEILLAVYSAIDRELMLGNRDGLFVNCGVDFSGTPKEKEIVRKDSPEIGDGGGGEIRQYEPNFFEKIENSEFGQSVVGGSIYGIFDDSWVTITTLILGANNSFHLNGAYTIGVEAVTAGINTLTNLLPIGSVSKTVGIGQKTLNAGQFNSLMKGTGVTAAKDGGVQILLYNYSITQSNQIGKAWNFIGITTTILQY